MTNDESNSNVGMSEKRNRGVVMTLDEAIAALRARNEAVPVPMRLPTEAEVRAVEGRLGVKFHPDLRRFLLEAGDVVFGGGERVTVAPPTGHTDMVAVWEAAWGEMGLPRKYVPFCEDNGDYYCMDRN